ncbi:membrane or secreted protein [Polaribacter sp. Asnod1-A03]|uniref:membrane or secreted protein n=1 Tax=Polaribacter sp. Asnod1-A03 TaxID=3160581 RepID=UPI00386BC817
MKKIIFLICILSTISFKAQSIIGAWETFTTSKNGEEIKNVVIFTEAYQVLTTYNAKTGKFIHTQGGKWKLDNDIMTENLEFNSNNSELIGVETSFKVIITKNKIKVLTQNIELNRIDNGKPGELQGAWLMSGRIKDGKTQLRDTSRPRKTMKILSGTRFQWIAYNTETKQFMGTGGGTYTTIDGKYTENIEFFSKDNTKVGLSLDFNYELTDGNWNHTGFSSKGAPIHEIWSIRKN